MSTLRRLKDDEVWRLVLPAYDPNHGGDAVTCTGTRLDAMPELASGQPRKGSTEDLVYGTGADRLKVVWLRTRTFGDGTDAGPLAVVRPAERFAELFAVGGFRGHSDRVRFTVPRLAGGFVVSAEDDGCKARKPNESCEALTTILLPRNGKLERAAEISTQKYKYVPTKERGTSGMLEIHGEISLQFTPTGIALTEAVDIRDEKGTPVRHAEAERSMNLVGDGLVASEPPLWDKVVKH